MSGSIVQGVSPSRFMRSPNLAARISALGDVQVEQKFTFGVLISGTLNGESFHFTGTDDGALGLAVKSFSKPDIEIETEELNQYNKKRLAVKGVKYKPMTLTLYDRADVLESFLGKYISHYIGDFNQPATSWAYDVINAEMIDAGDNGFGFGKVPETPDEQFVLNEITIVRGIAAARSTQNTDRSPRTIMRLIRPRITDIDFDDMDYQSSDPVLVTLTIMYEALLLGGETSGESENFVLTSLDGQPHELPYEGEVDIPLSKGKSPKDSIFTSKSGLSSFRGSGWRANGQGIGGVLGAFGNFSFGRLAGSLVTRAVTGAGTRGLGAELAFSATSNPILATLLNSSSSRSPLTDIGAAVLGTVAPPSNPAAAALWDVAAAGLSGVGRPNRAGYVVGDLVSGVLASRRFSGAPSNLPVRGGKPTSLSAQDYAVLNSRGSGVAQYGFNGSTGPVPNLGPVTREPLPPATPPEP